MLPFIRGLAASLSLPFPYSALRRVVLCLAVVGPATILWPAAGLADEVDIAVEAFAAGGSLVGVTVGQNEKELVKSIVRCAALAGRPVLACARNELIKMLPQGAQPLAQCLIGGHKTLEQCAVSGAVAQLPPQTQQVAECIATRGDLGQCGKNLATDQMSQAEQAALKEAFETIERLKIDEVARNPLTDTPGSIQNIIQVVQGVRQNDWPKVVRYGGTEVAKLAGKVMMRIFLPAPLATALDPAVDALIEHRIDLFANIIAAAKARDERRLGELIVEAYIYLQLPLVQACALVPSGTVKDVVCGSLGRAAKEIIDLGGTVVAKGGAVTEDTYNALQDFVSGRRDDCGTRWEYYANHFAACMYQAALAKRVSGQRYADIEGRLNNQCRNHFEPCARKAIGIFGKTTSSRISDICNPVRDKFGKEVDGVLGKLQQAEAKLKQAAASFARSYPPVQLNAEMGVNMPSMKCQAQKAKDLIAGEGVNCPPVAPKVGIMCDRKVAVRKLVADCVNALNNQFHLVGTGGNCGAGAAPLPEPNWVEAACQAGAESSVKVDCRCPEGQVWTGSSCVQQRCPLGMLGNPPNCRCPQGKVWTGSSCVQSRCPLGMLGNPPNCRCPQGKVWTGNSCVQQRCPSGMIGTPPDCTCPQGMALSGGSCRPVPCPPGMIGSPPNCACPQGMMLISGRCRPVTCPPGMVGRPPNCTCPQGTALSGGSCRPVTCPPGMVGRPPNCACPQGMALSGGRCRPVPCPPGMIGRPPNCHRPAQPSRPAPSCPPVRTCVQWGKGAPGTLAGPCLRWEMRPSCPGNVK